MSTPYQEDVKILILFPNFLFMAKKPFLKKNSHPKKTLKSIARPHRSIEAARLLRGAEFILEELQTLEGILRDFLEKNK